MTSLRDHANKTGRSNVGAMLPPLEFVMRSLRLPRREAFYGRVWDERAVNWPAARPDTPPKEMTQ